MSVENNSSAEESKNGRPVVVGRDNEDWVVRNDGDSAILFKASEKEAAIKFAKEMAEQHGISLEIEDDLQEDEVQDEKPEKIKPCILVDESGGKWVVHHEGDTAILFTAPEKDMAVRFARDMAEEHGVSFKVD